jgi:hypothetical protein
MNPSVAKQLKSAPRDLRTVTGMIGWLAYRVSTPIKMTKSRIEMIIGRTGIVPDDRLYSRSTIEEV